ncbi:MAG: alpha/beta hydrolase [Bacteroidetes bacterium]|nr:alpha/beta hydrolase [Bacteroidota bacterium]MBU1717885.1 alpha/beta hydrolase [Bacteroidota bacterium]
MAWADIFGKRIFYRLIGGDVGTNKLPIIVFLHEGLGSDEQWKGFPDLLCKATGFPGLVYDRYGYGKSEKFSEARDGEYFTSEATVFLSGLLDTLEIQQPVILFGHSDGGSIALRFAGAFPERVKCLISVAAHVFLEEISLAGIRSAIDAFENGNLKKSLEKYHGDKTESVFWGWAGTWLNDSLRDWNMCDQLQAITCPSLIVQGLDDVYGSPAQVHEIAKAIGPAAETWLIPDCGHAPHLERTAEVVARCQSFIARNVFGQDLQNGPSFRSGLNLL